MSRSSADILTEPPPPEADARLSYGAGPLQFGDLRLPKTPGPHPLVVFIHGGYWQAIYNLIHAGHLCVDLATHGIASWNVEYRRIGDVGGGWSTTADDVLRALAHVPVLAQEHPIDLERVVVAGHSAGGQLAVWSSLHTDVPLRGVVSIAGVVDMHMLAETGDDHGMIERLLGGPPDAVPDRWRDASPRQHLPWPTRTILACGTGDVHWGPNQATAEAALAAGGDVELLALPEAGHFEPVDPGAPQWHVVRERIEELLRGRTPDGS
jgi:acetyl esterase/lipase